MTDAPALSNSLTELADQVKAAGADAEAAERHAAEQLLAVGSLLAAAKDECRHGQWLPFLERAGVPERKAQRLMQIARAGVTSDTVTDLGGLIGTLTWLAGRRLPEAGEILFAALPHEVDPIAVVVPSAEMPGHFDLYGLPYGGREAIFTKRPVSGAVERLEGGRYINPVWLTLDRLLDLRQSETVFRSALAVDHPDLLSLFRTLR